MIVLGIETTCDETGVGIIKDNEILASEYATSLAQHAEFGGIIPEVAARMHLEVIDSVIELALKNASARLEDIDAIAVAAGPGLMPCLSVGAAAAKALAFGLHKPVYAVNHIIAHCDIASMKDGKPNASVKFPLIALIVSGGHCALYLVNDFAKDVRILGSTLDDAPGECFDKVGRKLGLEYPAGPIIDMLARQGDANKYEFPMGLTAKKYEGDHKFDFSFSGAKTSVANFADKNPNAKIEDVCASFSKAVADVLLLKSAAAMQEYGISQILVGGGFSANSQLRDLMQSKLDAIFPEMQYCTDNGVMIAKLGYDLAAAGVPASKMDFTIDSSLELDQVQL